MNDIILLKVGEIILKGLNRRRFEQKLLGNIRWRLSRIGKFRVYILQSAIYVEGEDGADMDSAFEELQKVFGIVAISRAAACEKDKDAIANLAKTYLRDEMLRAKSFKVESKRSCTIPRSPCILRCGIWPPMSMPPRCRARAGCPWAPTAWRCRFSPAASTVPCPPG